MKRMVAVAGIVFAVGCGGVVSQEVKKGTDFTKKGEYIQPVVSLEEAKKEMEEYIKGTPYVSLVEVCEGNKYYIGQVYLEGYENFDVVRKLYVDKRTGDLLPTMAETFDYCYTAEK
ncbi:hypothetical protein [Persephonella sp.]